MGHSQEPGHGKDMRKTGNEHRKAEIMTCLLGPCGQLSSTFRNHVLIAKGTFDTSRPPHMGADDPIVHDMYNEEIVIRGINGRSREVVVESCDSSFPILSTFLTEAKYK